MDDFEIKPLTPETWDAFAGLVERHSGIFGGWAGGGVVEGYRQDLSDGRRVNNSFLYNGTRPLYEEAGFTYDRPKGKNHTVMRRTVAPA
jgi:hypothetical protein